MRTPGRHAEVIKRMIELTGCESREITHNREVTSFIADAKHGRIGTLIFKGWTFKSFPSRKIQA